MSLYKILKNLQHLFIIKFKINKVDAVIYFENDFELIKKWVLDPIGIKTTAIRNPIELVINYIVIYNFLKNIKLIIGNKILKRAKIVYEKSIIQAYNPKIVITFKYNSYYISEVSKIDNNRLYIAIQNGTSFDYNIEDIPKSNFKEINKNALIFLTWGKYTESIFKLHSDYNCNYIPVGSFRQSISTNYINETQEINNKKFDLCMVSTVYGLRNYDIVRKLYNNVLDDEWNQTNRKIAMYLKRYINDNKKSLVIVLRGNNDYETNMYKSIFGKEDDVYIAHRENLTTIKQFDFKTYQIINRSDLILSFASSITLEAAAIGKKIIQVDYSLNKQYFINYYNGIWQISDNSYESFSDKLGHIIDIDISVFNQTIKDYKDYMIEYDVIEPTYLKIQNIIKYKMNINRKKLD